MVLQQSSVGNLYIGIKQNMVFQRRDFPELYML